MKKKTRIKKRANVKPKIKCVILDCDGVILDSNETYVHLYKILFRKYGLVKRNEEIYEHFGESPEQIIREMFPHRDVRKIFRDYKSQLNNPSLNRTIKMHPGAAESIGALEKKYSITVVSGALRARLVHSMKKFHLFRKFKFVTGADDVKRGKPDPEALFKVLKRLRLKKNEAIFVGDAPNDVQAAHSAGIKFIAVLSGVMDRKMARRLKADYIVNDINSVEKIVKKINS